jgi:hypothetical protein
MADYMESVYNQILCPIQFGENRYYEGYGLVGFDAM